MREGGRLVGRNGNGGEEKMDEEVRLFSCRWKVTGQIDFERKKAKISKGQGERTKSRKVFLRVGHCDAMPSDATGGRREEVKEENKMMNTATGYSPI